MKQKLIRIVVFFQYLIELKELAENIGLYGVRSKSPKLKSPKS